MLPLLLFSLCFHSLSYDGQLSSNTLYVELSKAYHKSTNYHMAAMIEQLNEVPSINYLLGKVESIAKRSSLRPLENILLSHFAARCFYCNKVLTGQNR
jgi:hypothetical protein